MDMVFPGIANRNAMQLSCVEDSPSLIIQETSNDEYMISKKFSFQSSREKSRERDSFKEMPVRKSSNSGSRHKKSNKLIPKISNAFKALVSAKKERVIED
jgi:hypothetical protein